MADAGAALAERLFAALRAASLDPPGVSRASYGPGERAAHGLARAEAEALGLEVSVDPIGTLSMTLPGADRAFDPATKPRLRAFLDKIHARPAYRRALERGGAYSYA